MEKVKIFIELVTKHRGVIKKFFAAVGVLLAALGSALIDNVITPAEWVAILAAFLGAFGVYQLDNDPMPKELGGPNPPYSPPE